MSDLDGRTALVTGGASGIGAACARELAARGAVVTVADVDEAGAKDLAQDIGGQAWAVDLLNVSALENLKIGRAEAYGAVSTAARRLGEGVAVEALIAAGLQELGKRASA